MNEEETRRIRDYLQGQAAKLSTDELLQKVRADQERLLATAAAVPAGRFQDTPGDGEWSANNVLAHIVEYGAAVGAGIRAVLDGERPPAAPPIDQPAQDRTPRDLVVWRERLLADRNALLARVERAPEGDYFDVRWSHPTFGDLNWREWLLFLRIHDVDHIGQLRKIVSAAGGQASG